jgi:hypothetical protein
MRSLRRDSVVGMHAWVFFSLFRHFHVTLASTTGELRLCCVGFTDVSISEGRRCIYNG